KRTTTAASPLALWRKPWRQGAHCRRRRRARPWRSEREIFCTRTTPARLPVREVAHLQRALDVPAPTARKCERPPVWAASRTPRVGLEPTTTRLTVERS